MSDRAPQCHVCAAPTGDQENLCRTHTDELDYNLRALSPRWELRRTWGNGPDRRELVPGLIDELGITITRQDHITAERQGGRSATTPLYWNDHASACLFELNATINAWALDVSKIDEDERDPLAGIHCSDTAAVASWLARNLSTLRHHPEAGTAYDEIQDAYQRGQRAVDLPKFRNRFYAGPCPQEPLVQHDDGTEEHIQCQGEVWAFIATGDEMSYLFCKECTASWDTTQWLRAGRAMLARKAEIDKADQIRNVA